MRQELSSGVIAVVCEFTSHDEFSGYIGKQERFTALVSDSCLWDSHGMSHLFNVLRNGYLANPTDHPGDHDIEDSWDSFHIVSITPLGGEHFFIFEMPGDTTVEGGN